MSSTPKPVPPQQQQKDHVGPISSLLSLLYGTGPHTESTEDEQDHGLGSLLLHALLASAHILLALPAGILAALAKAPILLASELPTCIFVVVVFPIVAPVTTTGLFLGFVVWLIQHAFSRLFGNPAVDSGSTPASLSLPVPRPERPCSIVVGGKPPANESSERYTRVPLSRQSSGWSEAESVDSHRTSTTTDSSFLPTPVDEDSDATPRPRAHPHFGESEQRGKSLPHRATDDIERVEQFLDGLRLASESSRDLVQ